MKPIQGRYAIQEKISGLLSTFYIVDTHNGNRPVPGSSHSPDRARAMCDSLNGQEMAAPLASALERVLAWITASGVEQSPAFAGANVEPLENARNLLKSIGW